MDEKRTAWERLQLVHTKGRPTIKDYIPQIFTDFYEMHGDRLCGDDKAILGGTVGGNDQSADTAAALLRAGIHGKAFKTDSERKASE